jgi:ornithine decarboxylase
MTPRIEEFIAREKPQTPCVIVDLEEMVANYRAFAAAAPWADMFYAVKANPAPQILSTLVAEGAGFDAASPWEISACLAAGAAPKLVSYGNTVKKRAHIEAARAEGIDLFALDSSGEIEKLAVAAPGAKVFCRIVVANDGARWPLTRKFGCAPDEAVPLLEKARDAGLVPVGLSFHAGSQQTEPARWCEGVNWCANLFERAARRGITLDLVNIGGGFPVPYRDGDVPEPERIFDAIGNTFRDRFGDDFPRVIVEPGRAVVARAGIVRSEVILVTERSFGGAQRWTYLDIGRYGGLAESEGEAIQYTFTVDGKSGPGAQTVVAGPTCDSHDVIYETSNCELPEDLTAGDIVTLHNAGAYTTTYASAKFNGFGPPDEYYI